MINNLISYSNNDKLLKIILIMTLLPGKNYDGYIKALENIDMTIITIINYFKGEHIHDHKESDNVSNQCSYQESSR
jgi:hypothetical protein